MVWCKTRALQYCDVGNAVQAFASMASDLNKCPETRDHAGIDLGMNLLHIGELSSVDEMRRFIEGFH